MFGKTRSTVYDQYKNYIRGDAKNGRPPSLSDEEIQTVIQYIHSLHTNSEFPVFPTFDDIQDFIIENFHKEIKDDTIRCIIERTLSDYFKTVDAKPIEVKRMAVQLSDIENNINTLADEITDVPMPFVFNLDEMGTQEWADAYKKRVIVPAGYRLNSAPYAIERGGKRISLTCCISPLGLVGKPQFAVPRTQGDISIFKYLPYDALQIIHTKSGYATSRSLEIYFNSILYQL